MYYITEGHQVMRQIDTASTKPIPVTLSPEQNERACNMVITAVAQYPQDWDGAHIVASSLLQEFVDIPSPLHTGIGIREMSRMSFDGKAIAKRVNDIHDRFGIDYRLESKQAESIVRTVAHQGVTAVSSAVLKSVWDRQMPFYDELAGDSATRRRYGFFGRHVINLSRVDRIYSVLETHQEIREEVIARLGERAADVRAKSHERQQNVVRGYRQRGSRYSDGARH